jgi:hypothetical protein
MHSHKLKESIATLEKLRAAHHSQLDASVMAELDDVLKELTRFDQLGKRDVPLGEIALRGLSIIDNILRVVTNVTNFLK